MYFSFQSNGRLISDGVSQVLPVVSNPPSPLPQVPPLMIQCRGLSSRQIPLPKGVWESLPNTYESPVLLDHLLAVSVCLRSHSSSISSVGTWPSMLCENCVVDPSQNSLYSVLEYRFLDAKGSQWRRQLSQQSIILTRDVVRLPVQVV